MDYKEFAQKFLRALYLETEESGKPYHRAGDLIDKYALKPKLHWISRLADDWEFSNFKGIAKVLDGYEGWSFRISAQGSQQVEDELEAQEIIDTVFGGEGIASTSPSNDLPVGMQEASGRIYIGDGDPPSGVGKDGDIFLTLAPASDRIVKFDHNHPDYSAISEGLSSVREAVREINDTDVDEDERARVLAAFDAAQTFWGAAQLKVIQLRVGVLMAVEDAVRILGHTAKALAAALLVDTIKSFVKNHAGVDLDNL